MQGSGFGKSDYCCLYPVVCSLKFKPMNKLKMIDISGKDFTKRTAKASVKIKMPKAIVKKIKNGSLLKGDCLSAARVAGILAAKQTPSIIPLCHTLQLSYASIDFEFSSSAITVFSEARASYATGVEMEALTACAVAALTIYDMAKAETKDIRITDLKLLEKKGGKTGDYKSS